MGVETATYISDLVATNPLGTDAKSQGDDHLRLLKSTIKATFPNVAGPVTVTHTQLNTVPTRADKTGETYSGTHNFTGATINVPTQLAADNTAKAASTAFVQQVAFSAAVPNQAGNAGKHLTTNGTVASWDDLQGRAIAFAVVFGA